MAVVYVYSAAALLTASLTDIRRADIHGSGATSEYLDVSSSFKNPADTSDAQGIKITIVCPA